MDVRLIGQVCWLMLSSYNTYSPGHEGTESRWRGMGFVCAM